MKNIVSQPTCFKSEKPTSVDVVISNVFKRLQCVFCYDTGLSDFHHMVLFATKIHVITRKPRKIMYRSYKFFDKSNYVKDLSMAPFHVGEVFDDINDAYWFCENLMRDVINEHAPVKHRVVRHAQVPYMNGELRRAINYKNMLRRKYEKNKNSVNWQTYRTYRNKVVRLRKQSKSKYLGEKCNDTNNSKVFWSIVKPLISDKCKVGQEHIVLNNNDIIVNESPDVCNIFNKYYNNVATNIGQDPREITCYDKDADFDVYMNKVLQMYSDHPSINAIQSSQPNMSSTSAFCFKKVSHNDVCKRLEKLKDRKSPGYDNIPPKLVKIGASVLCYPLQHLINKSVDSSVFPDALKNAEIIPVFKKGDNLLKENYRPVSILPCFSKIFEGVIVDQLAIHFDTHFSEHISGFRKGHDCQNVLLRFSENIKCHLDDNDIAGAVLTDLSKAFDCLPHDLLISKMYHYGVSRASCQLVTSYFKGRYHRVKLGSARSDWLPLKKGAPQGSIMGPFSYNVHSNDLIVLLERLCDIFNYADDNTVCCYGKSVKDVKDKLEDVINKMLYWFEVNEMKVNNDKFQFILFSKNGMCKDELIKVGDTVIMMQNVVKLLGFFLIDYSLLMLMLMKYVVKQVGNCVC